MEAQWITTIGGTKSKRGVKYYTSGRKVHHSQLRTQASNRLTQVPQRNVSKSKWYAGGLRGVGRGSVATLAKHQNSTRQGRMSTNRQFADMRQPHASLVSKLKRRSANVAFPPKPPAIFPRIATQTAAGCNKGIALVMSANVPPFTYGSSIWTHCETE